LNQKLLIIRSKALFIIIINKLLINVDHFVKFKIFIYYKRFINAVLPLKDRHSNLLTQTFHVIKTIH